MCTHAAHCAVLGSDKKQDSYIKLWSEWETRVFIARHLARSCTFRVLWPRKKKRNEENGNCNKKDEWYGDMINGQFIHICVCYVLCRFIMEFSFSWLFLYNFFFLFFLWLSPGFILPESHGDQFIASYQNLFFLLRSSISGRFCSILDTLYDRFVFVPSPNSFTQLSRTHMLIIEFCIWVGFFGGHFEVRSQKYHLKIDLSFQKKNWGYLETKLHAFKLFWWISSRSLTSIVTKLKQHPLKKVFLSK